METLRERLEIYGEASLSTRELLAFILSSSPTRKDMLPIASRLLEKYGTRELYTISEAELVQEGLTPAKVQLLKAVRELALRLSMPHPRELPHILTAEAAAHFLRPFFAHLDHEEFRVLVLNSKNRVIANVLLYKGTVNGSLIRPSEIFREAIVRNCPHILIAHNHPAHDPTPSQEDYKATQQLIDAGRLLDIQVLDHVIIGDQEHVSMKSRMQW